MLDDRVATRRNFGRDGNVRIIIVVPTQLAYNIINNNKCISLTVIWRTSRFAVRVVCQENNIAIDEQVDKLVLDCYFVFMVDIIKIIFIHTCIHTIIFCFNIISAAHINPVCFCHIIIIYR